MYLLENKVIKVIKGHSELTPSELSKIAESQIERFKALYKVYVDLKKRGFIVRRGLKFGCDYLVYKYGPGIDHAPFGVLVYYDNEKIDPIELVRAGRLLHSVRKKLIIAIYSGEGIKYIVLNWWKP